MPKTDKDEPRRENALRDSELPRVTKSSTDKDDASRVMPKTDIDDPNRAKLRNANELPKLM
jgi:hypothetical protein